MRIATKINIALVTVLTCGIAATFTVLNSTVLPQFEELEHQAASANHKRVTEALSQFTEKLKTATHDYAWWDETYRFVQDDSYQDFIESNLVPEFKAVENLGINALVFLRSDGTVRWSSAYNLETGEKLPTLAKEIANISNTHRSVDGKTPEPLRGLVMTSVGPVLIAIAPALKSDRSGPAMGAVASAKFLSNEAVHKLTGVNFELLFDFSRNDIPPGKVPVIDISDRALVLTSLVKDINNQPLAILKSTTDRDISRAGLGAIHSAILMMLFGGILLTSVLWYFLQRMVVERIQYLREHFMSSGTDGVIAVANVAGDEDEIYDLTTSFNTMADQVNILRDRLADSAYMSGLSEWGAGTLHNVRNGIAPITASTWQIRRLVEQPLLGRLKIASAELMNGPDDPEREQKLKQYLALGMDQLETTAKESITLTDSIDTATHSILDMVSEFERYARKETELEELPVRQLVNSVIRAEVGSQMQAVDVQIADEQATVRANGIILRQVLSNLLKNAIEATAEKSDEERKIKITVEDDANHSVRISISDNGHGIEAENLPKLFVKGFSMKSDKNRGLGLHWCANALKLMKGSIQVESQGRGHGTTFSILIPRREQELAKAA